MPNSNLELLLMIFVGLTGLAVLLQAFVLLGLFLTVRRAVQTGKDEAGEFLGKVSPIIDTSSELLGTTRELVAASRTLIGNLDPKLTSAATELAQMTREIHAQTTHIQASLDQIAQKARLQADRVDSMTTSVLDSLDRFGRFINEAVRVPVRQVNGVVAAAKAVVETLRAPVPPRPRRTPAPASPDPVSENKNMFV